MKSLYFLLSLCFVLLGATALGQTTYTSTATGNWSTMTWAPVGTPGATDTVVIADGHTVTINTPVSVTQIIVGQGTSGILTYEPTTARAVAVSGDVTVSAGASFTGPASGSVTTHTLAIGGNLINNGTFNMAGASSRYCTVTFNKVGDQTISGSGTTTQFRGVILSKGSPSNKVIASINISTGGTQAITFTNGTWQQSAGTLTTGGSQDIGVNGVLLIDGSGVLNAGAGTSAVSGSLTVNTSGTATFGNSNNTLSTSGGTITFTSGTVNIYGKLNLSSGTGTLIVNGATVNIYPVAVTATSHSFQISGTNSLTFSSGTITLKNGLPSVGTGTDISITASTAPSVISISGTAKFVLGSGVGTTASADGFEINCNSLATLQDLEVNTGSIACKTTSSGLSVKGILTLTSGTLGIGAQTVGGVANTNAVTALTLYNPIAGTASNLLQTLHSTTSAPLSSIKITGTSSGINIPSNISQLKNLTTDNSNGTTLQGNLTVDTTLTLTNGVIATGANTLTASGSISGASSSSYVDGKLARPYSVAASKAFPIGKGGNYRPLTLNYTSIDAPSTVTAEQFESAMTGTLPADVTLGPSRYHTLTQTGASTYTYDITLDSTGFTPTGSARILKKDGTIAAYPTTAPNYTATGLTGFSDFALGDYVVSNVAPTATSINITGTPAVGQLLTGNYTYGDVDGDLEGTSTFRWLRNGSPIGGATALTYTAVLADLGQSITFEVTPVAATGTSPGTAATSSGVTILNSAPTATAVNITGTPAVGQLLTGSYTFGDVDGDLEGTSTFRWLRNGSPIGGATALTYTAVLADLGQSITFEVTPVAATGTSPGTPVVSNGVTILNSAPTATAVNITGTPSVGQLLTGNYTYGDVDGDLEGTSTFRWLRNASPIGGATAVTYTLVGADVGATVTFEVTPVAATGTSPGTPVVSGGVSIGNSAPTATLVNITGTPGVGQLLTGNYTYGDADLDAEGTSTFRWLRNGSPIGGATALTYTAVLADLGQSITFEVTPVAATGTSPGTAVVSGGVTILNSAPTATAVNITGTPAVGLLLTGNYTYNDVDGDLEGTSTFRWLRNGSPIGGATALTYTAVLADLGQSVTFEVTPVAATGTSPGTPVVSSGVTILNSAPTATAVNITGTPAVGQLLTGNYTYGDVDGDLEGASTFRWLRNASPIGGATATTYTLVGADVGATVTFEVTPVAATGTSPGSPVVSSGVTILNSAPIATSVNVTGTPGVGQLLTGNYTYSDADLDAEGTSTFRWLRNGSPIGGATALTYTAVLADLGQSITFEVTPVAATGTSPGTAVVSGGVAILNSAPTATAVNITGTPNVGLLLTGSYTYGDADGDLEGTSTFRWLRNASPIGGATALTYTAVPADLGQTITFEVTPVAATGTSPGTAATSSGVIVLAPIAAEPTIAASSITFSGVSTAGMTVNWVNGDGANRIVVAHPATAVSFTPTDGVTMTGVNANFSSATDQGSGNKVVYSGPLSSIPVTGLSPGTTYHFTVYEFNGSPGTENYLTTSAPAGNQKTHLLSIGTGNWSATSTWPGGVLPVPSDHVVIADGSVVTLDMDATVASLNVGQGVSGTLQTSKTILTNLTINGDLTVDAGASYKAQSATTSFAGPHTLTISGSITNNGTVFDLRTGSAGSTLGVINVIFAGSTNSTVTMNPPFTTTNGEFNAVTINKTGSAKVILGSNMYTASGASTGPQTMNSIVTFVNGVIETGNFTFVALTTTAANVTGYSTSSYVVGEMGRGMASTGTSKEFPVGDANGYRPFNLRSTTGSASTGYYAAVRVITGNSNTGSSALNGGIDRVSAIRYYKVTYNQGTTTTTTMDFDRFRASYGSDDGVLAGNTDLRSAYSTDSRATWTKLGQSNPDTTNFISPPSRVYPDSLNSPYTLTSGSGAIYVALADTLGGVNPLGGPVPTFVLDSASVDFGSVAVSGSKQDSVTVSNTGGFPLTISSVSSSNPLFGVTPASATIPIAGSAKFYVTFSPTAIGAETGSIIFSHNAATTPDSLPLNGTGVSTGPLVTFRVDMRPKMLDGFFEPDTDFVEVRGGFNGWSAGDTLADGDNDSIYTKTLTLAASTSYDYKFYKSPRGTYGWEDGISNRNVMTGTADTVLPAPYFNDDDFTVPATFSVNMKIKLIEGTFTPPAQGVFVRGNFNNWSGPVGPMTDGDNDSIYTFTTGIPSGKLLEYKFWADPGLGWESVSNRQFNVLSNTSPTLPVWYFDDDSIANIPGFLASPSSIAFGGVEVADTVADSVYVYNTGLASLNISSITSDNSVFTVTPNSGTLAVGESLLVVVFFNPDSAQSESGTISFTHDAAGSPGTVSVSGTGYFAPPMYFLSLSPDSVFNEDPLKPGKSKKPVKHQKHLYPNWSNLIDEVNAQGGFAPVTSESDSAGGMVIGRSFMYPASPSTPLTPKWKVRKELADIFCWVRLAKWDFKKSIGKSFDKIQKTLYSKGIGNHTGAASGFDTTTDGKFKNLKKQLTYLYPKKQNNKLYAELVALKVNIAASAMGKTPAGFGDLIYDMNGSPYDEMSVIDISNESDSMMTVWMLHTQEELDSLYSAVYNINRAFVGPLDTLTFDTIDSIYTKGKLTVAGQVDLNTVPYLKLPTPFVATKILAQNTEVESPEDFEDEEFDEEGGTPVAAKLYQNYPNPFNPSTTIAFNLREVSTVTVKIYNMLGQEVATLVNGEDMDEGFQTLQFSADQLSSGVYFYRIDAQGTEDAGLKTIETRKMVLLK